MAEVAASEPEPASPAVEPPAAQTAIEAPATDPASPATTLPATTEPRLEPVPAETVPDSEPLLQDPAEPAPEPAASAAVQAMPRPVPGVTLRRGAEAGDAAPQPVEGVTLGRLPAIGAAPPPATGPEPVLEPAARRHAAEFSPEPGASLLGLVLIDAPEAEAALSALAFKVTVALDPSDPDAPRRARAYRAAGHEIALLASGLPRLATAADVLVTLNAWTADFPEIIGVMDVPVNGIGAQRGLAQELAAMLAPDGYGAIALRGGADAYLSAARDAGLPAAAVYRQIDGEGQNPATLRRLIDRAAFEAQRQSGILIAGSAASPDTLAALAAYAADGRRGVTLAPASAVLAN